jgi:hypothetical protein
MTSLRLSLGICIKNRRGRGKGKIRVTFVVLRENGGTIGKKNRRRP